MLPKRPRQPESPSPPSTSQRSPKRSRLAETPITLHPPSCLFFVGRLHLAPFVFDHTDRVSPENVRWLEHGLIDVEAYYVEHGLELGMGEQARRFIADPDGLVIEEVEQDSQGL